MKVHAIKVCNCKSSLLHYYVALFCMNCNYLPLPSNCNWCSICSSNCNAPRFWICHDVKIQWIGAIWCNVIMYVLLDEGNPIFPDHDPVSIWVYITGSFYVSGDWPKYTVHFLLSYEPLFVCWKSHGRIGVWTCNLSVTSPAP